MHKKKLAILSFLVAVMYSNSYAQDAEQLLLKINSLQRIAGSSIGKTAGPSEEYQIFEALEKLSTHDVVGIFQNTDNPIGKVFCYWALKERKYINSSIYREYLKNLYFNIKVETQWYGCITGNEQLARVIDYDFRKYWSGKT